MMRMLRIPCIAFLAGLSWAYGQIVTFTEGTTTTVSIGAASTQGGFTGGASTYTFQNNVRTLDSLSDGVDTYSAVFGFDRVDATQRSSPSAGKLYYLEGGTPLGGTSTSFTGQYKSTFDSLFDTPFQINVGSDNVLEETYDSLRVWSNTGVIISTTAGLTDAGISIIERGANDTNFRVRAITSLDGSNNPDTFSDWFSLSGGDPFGDGLRLDGDANPTEINWFVFEDTSGPDFTGPFLNLDAENPQAIAGFMIPMTDFGLSVGNVVYGYEIEDGPENGRSGIDLIPAGGFVSSDPGALTVIPEPSTLMLFAAGLLGLMSFKRSKIGNN